MRSKRGVLLGMLLPLSVMAADMPTFQLEMKDGQFISRRIDVLALGSGHPLSDPCVDKKKDRNIQVCIAMPAKTPVRLLIVNTGKTAAEFESLPLRKEKVLAPGVNSSVVFRSLSPGEYLFFDDFHSKAKKGVIVVK